MIEPEEKDIGRVVVYTGNHNGPLEEGVITSFNHKYVFVRYSPTAIFGIATAKEDLEWQNGNKC